MSIPIIIDKSTFQMLSYNELLYVSNYYKHNITPVLTMEVLGDLKKEVKEGNPPPEERVKDFARKLFPVYTIVNTHYRNLIYGDLLGNRPSLDGRPNVNIEKVVTSESGMKGQIIIMTKEEKSIYKWKDGDFNTADHELSEFWRSTTTQEDVLINLKETLLSSGRKPDFKDFSSLNEMVDRILEVDDIQELLLGVIIQLYGIDGNTAVKIFSRWYFEGKPLIKSFSPYAFHCLKVDTLFIMGLTSSLIHTRPTNAVDCEYLYYLPFCKVFTSNDKLHKNLVPLLLRPDQKFITGEQLKEDMAMIHNYFEEKGIEEKRKFKDEPPIIENSFTFQLWHEYFGYPENISKRRKVSEEDLVKAKAKIDEFIRASKGEKIEMSNEEDVQFIVKESFLSKDDPCYCGSGKKVIECCIPPEQFEQMANKR